MSPLKSSSLLKGNLATAEGSYDVLPWHGRDSLSTVHMNAFLINVVLNTSMTIRAECINDVDLLQKLDSDNRFSLSFFSKSIPTLDRYFLYRPQFLVCAAVR